MTTAVQARPVPKVAAVDRFLTFLRIAMVLLIGTGLFAFVWQQISPTNPLASAINPDAASLTLEQFKGLLVAGLSQGTMYGLIAIGYSMVYGVLGFINFAHGEVFMVGSMSGFITSEKLFSAGIWQDQFILSFVIIMIVAMTTSTVTAVVMERVAYRPLRSAPRLIPLITSIGVSFFIQNAVLGLLGPATKTYPQLPETLSTVRRPLGFLGDIPVLNWFDFAISGTRMMVFVVSGVSFAVLWFLVERTKTGKAMRAVAEDKEIASLMGINVDRIIVLTFGVGGAMAGVAGIMWGLTFRSITHVTGFLPGIKAFTAAVVGGVGNLGGAMAGGIGLGTVESMAPLMILEPLGVGSPSQLRDLVAFTALVVVLLFKPTGLFGEKLSAEDRT